VHLDQGDKIKDEKREKQRNRAMEMKLEQHTKIFASMCPDEILDYYDNYATRMYYTTLMLGDVSGFTDLAEKYTKTGRGGPSKLTETLNSYIGAMVQEILSHNGDVLKFSGDAFIVMWKLNEGMMMRDLAIEAMQTACIIQKHFGTYETEVGVTLKAILIVSYTRPRGGDILVAPSSWQWVNPNEYVHETLEDGVHTLILACTSTWYQSRDDEAQVSTEDENERIDYYDSTGFASKTVMGSETEAVMMSLAGNLERERFKQIDYSLRPKVIKIAKARLKDALRSYMLRPVIRSVEMDEPLEYLTEMRQVVILFINVLTSTVGKRTLISLVNSAYKLVCKIVGGMHGCVNKTSLFDKDLMFLCVFGLRGDKHELESQIGLKCASKLRNTLAGLKYVKSVTVSVTTGMTYCGVVGHILRREYTVIGMSVNKAARLMVAYRDKVAPYSLILMIFSMSLAFTVSSMRKEREDKLLRRLGKVRQSHFLCALNQPFNVRFPITHRYNMLSDMDKWKILRKFLLKLLKSCFTELWVIIIDDAEYTDHESLRLFDIIELHGIDRWFHAGLACQTLNVNGLPAELEKFASTAPITRIEDSFEERKDRWQMYRMSFKDSLISLLEESSGNPHKLEITADTDETLIAVCKISEKFSYDDVDTEITMDVMILKLFDSLTPLDQLLLKCASVIGETVNRHMLECLMNLSAKREIGLAVAKLFEIRVFGCAIGDFSSNTGPIVFIQNVRNPTTETDIFCNCVGLTVPNVYKNRKRLRLLTENQKMELHNQALKYLKQYTRRCAFCGEGQFAKLLGNVSKREDRLKKRAVIEGMFESVEFRSASAIKEIERNQKKWFSCLNLFRRVERRPTITFSDVDFSNCQCDLILMTVYTQMLDHCRGIGLNEMTMIAILEFAEICLMTSNIPQARKLLAESETILGKLFSATEDEVIVLPYLTSKIQTLQGQCYLESGSLFEAEQILEAALNNLGYKFPKMEIMIDLKSIAQLVQLRWKFSCINDWNLNTDYVATQSSITQCADYTEQLAECLAKMFDLFRIKGMKRHARLAAIWGLNTALETNRNLFVLSTSYTNMLITAHMYQDRAIVPFLEEKGLEICRQSKDAIESQELNMIAELYAGIFFSRWVNGQISKAIKIGFICCRMAAMVGSTFLKLLIMPRLAHLLMLSCRHSEAITQLRELEFESNYDLDKSGRTWYYALCADVQLDTGITLLSFKACEQYFLREGEAMISLHDPEAERRYFVSMWLWHVFSIVRFIRHFCVCNRIIINLSSRCVRTEQWEASIVWERRSVNNLPIMDEHIVAATITSLKRLEGLLILYVHKLNSRNIDAVTTLTEIKSIFREMKKMTKIVKLTIPT
ncbi:Adenylate cyclase type 10, partial [Dufourea novaeangliae]